MMDEMNHQQRYAAQERVREAITKVVTRSIEPEADTFKRLVEIELTMTSLLRERIELRVQAANEVVRKLKSY